MVDGGVKSLRSRCDCEKECQVLATFKVNVNHQLSNLAYQRPSSAIEMLSGEASFNIYS